MRSLLGAGERLNCDVLTIITFDEEKTIRNAKRVVKVVPAWKWFLKV